MFTLLAPPAAALPAMGEEAPDAHLADPDGRTLDVRALRGRPALILYEDKGSAGQNGPLKQALAARARDARYRAAVALAAVADVTAYAGWPLKGFAEEAVRSRARKAGVTIYCDWDGAFRRAYRLHRGLSNVVLLDPEGRVLFAAAGPLQPAQRAALLALIERQIART
jgi:predicted transcriptional regulator